MTFLEVAKEVLSKAEYPLTYREIWDMAQNVRLDKAIDSKGQTPQHTMRVAITNDIKNRKDSAFCIMSNYPARTFWLQSRKNEIIGKETEIEQKRQERYEKELKDDENKKGFKEEHLHPLLVKFLDDDERFKLYCKTIDAGSSKKKSNGLGVWNHPDIVGVHFPFNDYNGVAFELLSHTNQLNYKIYSFEIKRFINNANLKECYFQAVANSSWANEGYLVAYQIKLDERAYSEAERLNESFGIGMIELESGEVLFEARKRELDIRTFNMLVETNTDFRKFIENVNKNIKVYLEVGDSELIAKEYDEILNNEKLEAHKSRCGIK